MYHNYEIPNYMSPMMNQPVPPMPLPVPVPDPPACPGGTIYTIQPGDTMFRIANRYGIDLTELIRANPQIPNPNVIYVGQRICIPRIVIPPTPPDVFCPDGTIYIVQRGDTMFNIARRFGVTLERLIRANPQIPDPNVIDVGQKICIPRIVIPPTPPDVFCPDGTIYIVQQGDTMFNIARRFGVTLERLIRANPQIPDPNVIDVGQKICVPVPDIPLPVGIVRVELRPERKGVLGGTAFVNIPDPTVWISTFGLPEPAKIDSKLVCYYAWVVDRDADTYFRVDLKDCGLPGIMAGYGKTKGTFACYDEVIVTAEAVISVKKPTGPVLLRGRLVTPR